MGMVIVTEELSRGSLGAAGSLITRPEIMARALLEGGTEEQQARWLPQIAWGKRCVRYPLRNPTRDQMSLPSRSKQPEPMVAGT